MWEAGVSAIFQCHCSQRPASVTCSYLKSQGHGESFPLKGRVSISVVTVSVWSADTPKGCPPG